MEKSSGKKEYFCCNGVVVKTNGLNKRDFEINNVWVEHWIPDELVPVKKRNVPSQWIEDSFYESMRGRNDHPYFTILGDSKFYKKAEFVYVAALIFLAGKVLHGYVTVFGKRITTIKVFLNREVTFYFNEPFNNYNTRFFKKLERVVSTSQSPKLNFMDVFIKSEVKGIKYNKSQINNPIRITLP